MSSVPGDYGDMVDVLNKHGVEFVIVGAFAVTFHGSPRLTEDIDFLVRPTVDNTRRLRAALADFGSPVQLEDACLKPKDVIQIGVKPVRVDLIAGLTGVPTEDVWNHRIPGRFEGREVSFISRDHLLRNKLAAGRPKDLLDARNLERLKKQGPRR